MDKSPIVVQRIRARKRLSGKNKCKRYVAKLERYSAKSLPDRPNCIHKKTYECNSLTMSDLIDFHTCFYKHRDKRSQDAFILKHMTISKVARYRPRKSKYVGRNSSNKYYIRLIKGEINYMIDTGVFRSVCKKNKRTSEIDAQNMQTMGIIKSAKVKDVNKLLTSHFGDSWRTFQILCFYDKLIPQNVETDVDQQEDEENICEENVDTPDVRI
ncbi:unnamed protein product [Parnassius apollo]|uniref:(apollo) hypothetical protein n=1 Tax=Parnassius apollo TaxID=110799 RepID=A0A8S3Y258_PARAO|nr:unnamed protein product [Parnassius apollo]